MTNNHSCSFNKKLLTLTIAGLLSSPTIAQTNQQSQQAPQNSGAGQGAADFRAMDQDQDERLVWREIYVVMDPRIVAANLDQEQIFEQFDRDGDDALDEQEFEDFLGGLEQREIASGETQMQQGRENQQASGSTSGVSTSNRDNLEVSSEAQHGADQARVLPEQSRYVGGGGTASSDQGQQSQAGASEGLIRETQYTTEQASAASGEQTQATQRDQRAAGDQRPSDNTAASSAEGEQNSQQLAGAGQSGSTSARGAEANQRDELATGDQRPGDNSSAASAADYDELAEESEYIAGDSPTVSDEELAEDSDRNLYDEYSTVRDTDSRTQPATVEAGSAYERENQNTDSQDSMASSNAERTPNSGAGELRYAPLSSLQKKTVTNSAGEELGEVRDVVINRERGEVGLVVSSGGVLGIGSKKILAPADELSLEEDSLVWQTEQSSEELKESAKYRSEGYEEVSKQYGNINEIRQADIYEP